MNQVNIHLVGHFWSLAVEEQFYVVWPAVVLLASRRNLAIIATGCVLLAPVIRLTLALNHVNHEVIYRNTFCRMDGLMAGCLCAIATCNIG